ncbi:hypothetical protein [Enterobacter sp. RIT418]|uniref:hypothetical protein n=1 Tax=Enterobacter sp. RIT418 TaxID=2202164 RepID=UPI0015EC7033|nr:hypothetical protein [Enterobacter sp. RIT 418]
MKTLKIFIEPASLPLTQQLKNYVQSIDDENVFSVLILERLKLNNANQVNGRTVFAYKVNDHLSQKLDSVAKFIANKKDFKIEIHTNIIRETDILVPLLQRVLPKISLKQLQLHLYDDGTGTIIQRVMMGRFDGKLLSTMMRERSEVFQHVLMMDKPLGSWEWNIADNYIWHYFIDTKYYLLEPFYNKTIKNHFFDELLPFIIPLSYREGDISLLSNNGIWDRLLNIPEDLRIRLSAIAKNRDATLFLTTYCPDIQKRAVHHQAMLRKITELKSSGMLPNDTSIIYKGHPVNHELNHELCTALGDNITVLPDNIPLEYLHTQNLLPKNIAGCFGTSFFSMKDKNVKFVIMNGDKYCDENIMNIEIIQMHRCFDTDKIIYLEETS